MCHHLVGNSGTVADRGERQVTFCNQVKFDSDIPVGSGRKQVKLDSSHPANSSSPQVQFDSGTHFASQTKGWGCPVCKLHVGTLQQGSSTADSKCPEGQDSSSN